MRSPVLNGAVKHAFLVGKGPSLDRWSWAWAPPWFELPRVAVNEAALLVPALSMAVAQDDPVLATIFANMSKAVTVHDFAPLVLPPDKNHVRLGPIMNLAPAPWRWPAGLRPRESWTSAVAIRAMKAAYPALEGIVLLGFDRFFDPASPAVYAGHVRQVHGSEADQRQKSGVERSPTEAINAAMLEASVSLGVTLADATRLYPRCVIGD